MALEDAGVDIIEAGFPINGKTEQKSIKMIIREVENPEIALLCRPIPEEIDLCQDLLSKANKSRLHLWIATSPIHMKDKLDMTPDEVLKKAVMAIRYAAGKFDTIQFSSEDSTRSHLDFLGKIMREAVRAGADVVNLADTVGCAMPEHTALMVKHIRAAVKDRVPVGIHCHNDLGLATANTVSALMAGANHFDVTVTGIGERAGNASLEQLAIVMLFHSRHLNVHCNLKTDRLGALCDTVVREMNLDIEISHPLIGENAFKHESGIHVHGMLNNPLTYELVNPEELGLGHGEFIIGKHTGKAAVRHFLEKNGLSIDKDSLLKLTELIKEKTTYDGPFLDESELIDFATVNGFDLTNMEGFIDG